MSPEDEHEIELKLRRFKTDLNIERLERQSKLMNAVGLIVMGLIWGFIIAMVVLAHH
jgi:hypothetical protein